MLRSALAMTRNKGSTNNKHLATTRDLNLQPVGQKSTHVRLKKIVFAGSKSTAGTTVANAFDALDAEIEDSEYEQHPEPDGVAASPKASDPQVNIANLVGKNVNQTIDGNFESSGFVGMYPGSSSRA